MITGSKITLREKKLSDTLEDYAWHSDRELAELDAAPLLTTPFPDYLPDYACELHYPSPLKRAFSIETGDGRHIGNCAYYNIDEDKAEAEFGIMIGDRAYWGKGYGPDAASTLLKHIFAETKLNRIHLKTLTDNKRAYRCFEKCGFTPCGQLDKDGYHFTLMEIDRQRWQEKQPKGGKHSADKVAGQ